MGLVKTSSKQVHYFNYSTFVKVKLKISFLQTEEDFCVKEATENSLQSSSQPKIFRYPRLRSEVIKPQI